jgi:ABC-type sugar transport system substrate-binding protein
MKKPTVTLLLALVLAAPVGAAQAASDNAACVAKGIGTTPPGLRDDFVHTTQAGTDGPYGSFIITLAQGTPPLCDGL